LGAKRREASHLAYLCSTISPLLQDHHDHDLFCCEFVTGTESLDHITVIMPAIRFPATTTGVVLSTDKSQRRIAWICFRKQPETETTVGRIISAP